MFGLNQHISRTIKYWCQEPSICPWKILFLGSPFFNHMLSCHLNSCTVSGGRRSTDHCGNVSKSSVLPGKSLVGICQMTSTSDKEANFAVCSSLIEKANAQGALMVFLPEACDYITASKEQCVEMAEPLDGDLMTRYRQLARTKEIWLSIGGFHQKVVDPWGKVSVECLHGTDVMLAEVDLDYLASVRDSMPVHRHRRFDLYSEVIRLDVTSDSDLLDKLPAYKFGHVDLESSCLLARTCLSMAFVNIKPVLPGQRLEPIIVRHVSGTGHLCGVRLKTYMLVAPSRCVERFNQLSQAEVADLFWLTQKVSTAAQRLFSATSVTIAIQDGPDSGQTVKHVHVHVLPRKPGDFEENDEIYSQLQKHDRDLTLSSQLRTRSEMAEEANKMRRMMKEFICQG